MLNKAFLTILLFPAAVSNTTAEDLIPASLATRGEVLLSDDFQREELGDWKQIIPGFKVQDGVLVGTQDSDAHGSVGRIYVPMKDVVVSFRFKLAGSPRFNLVFDDKNYKGSHAGHICRVAVAKKQIRLGDDKEGIMRNDIFKLKRDPKTKPEADKLLKGRGSNVKVSLESNQWYTMEVQIVGDEMRVSLDGKAVGYLKSPGLSHAAKQSLHFTVSGKATHFDDVRIWKAET